MACNMGGVPLMNNSCTKLMRDPCNITFYVNGTLCTHLDWSLYLTLCMLHGTSFAHFVVSNDGARKQKDPTLQGVHSFTALVTEWLLSKWWGLGDYMHDALLLGYWNYTASMSVGCRIYQLMWSGCSTSKPNSTFVSLEGNACGYSQNYQGDLLVDAAWYTRTSRNVHPLR